MVKSNTTYKHDAKLAGYRLRLNGFVLCRVDTTDSFNKRVCSCPTNGIRLTCLTHLMKCYFTNIPFKTISI